MTIAKTGSSASYAGNGVTVAFSFPFRFFDDTDLKVYIVAADGTSTLQTLTTDYSISNAGDETGGTVTMVTAPASTETLLIEREVPETQSVDYQNNDAFPAETHEQALDRLTLLVQQQSRGDGLHLTFPTGDTNTPVLPTSSLRANKLLGFGTGGAIETFDPTTGIIDTEFDTVADLLASTKSFDVGVYVHVKDGDFTYKVVASGGDVQNSAGTPVEFEVITEGEGKFHAAAFGDLSTSFTSVVAAAVSADAARGKNGVIVPAGSYTFTAAIALTEGQKIFGGGARRDSDTDGAAVCTTSSDISLFDVNGKGTHIEGFKGVCTAVSPTASMIDCGDNVAYWNTFKNLTSNGFASGVSGARTLYHTYEDCSFDDNDDYGVRFTGAAGGWNTAWFNNAHTFVSCTFRRNGVAAASIKGAGIQFVQPDFSNCPIGLEFTGDSSAQRGRGFVVDCPYIESTNNPFKGTYADLSVSGGFLQGFGSPSAGDLVFDLDDATVSMADYAQGQDLWNKYADLTNGSELYLRRDGIFGVSGAISAKVTQDSTSKLLIAVENEQYETASLAPSGTEDIFTPDTNASYLITAVGLSFDNHYWVGTVLRAGGSSTLRITAIDSNRTSMTDSSGTLRITNTDGAQTTEYAVTITKIGGR